MARAGKETYAVAYDNRAVRDLANLDTLWQEEVRMAVEYKLMKEPELFGKPLRGTLKGCWSLRVGNYRVVYQLRPRIVRIIAIVHRSGDCRAVDARL